MRTVTAFLFASAIAWAQAPTNLAVTSATSTQVQLSWSGTSGNYTVQRAPVGGAFVNIATVSTTLYTDNQIDTYLEFTYQIINAGTSGTASNQVTVGPPPAGLALVAASPAERESGEPDIRRECLARVRREWRSGIRVPLWRSQCRQCRLRGTVVFPVLEPDPGAMESPGSGGNPGNVSSGVESTLALAFDSSTNTFALATMDIGTNIDLYVSTNGGSTWSLTTTFTGPAGMGGLDGPALALASGNIYLTYQAGPTGLRIRDGKAQRRSRQVVHRRRALHLATRSVRPLPAFPQRSQSTVRETPELPSGRRT